MCCRLSTLFLLVEENSFAPNNGSVHLALAMVDRLGQEPKHLALESSRLITKAESVRAAVIALALTGIGRQRLLQLCPVTTVSAISYLCAAVTWVMLVDLNLLLIGVICPSTTGRTASCGLCACCC